MPLSKLPKRPAPQTKDVSFTWVGHEAERLIAAARRSNMAAEELIEAALKDVTSDGNSKVRWILVGMNAAHYKKCVRWAELEDFELGEWVDYEIGGILEERK